jgi:hypothetical protein
MASSPIIMWVFVIMHAGIAAMKVTAALWLHRQRSAATWLILAGAVLSAAAYLLQISLMDLNGIYAPQRVWLLEWSLNAEELGDFIFIAGFVTFAARLRGERNRIFQLEEILRDQKRPVPPTGGNC